MLCKGNMSIENIPKGISCTFCKDKITIQVELSLVSLDNQNFDICLTSINNLEFPMDCEFQNMNLKDAKYDLILNKLKCYYKNFFDCLKNEGDSKKYKLHYNFIIVVFNLNDAIAETLFHAFNFILLRFPKLINLTEIFPGDEKLQESLFNFNQLIIPTTLTIENQPNQCNCKQKMQKIIIFNVFDDKFEYINQIFDFDHPIDGELSTLCSESLIEAKRMIEQYYCDFK